MDLMILWIVVFVIGLIVIIPMSLLKQKHIHEQQRPIRRMQTYIPQKQKEFQWRQDDAPTFDPRSYQSGVSTDEQQKHHDQYKNAWNSNKKT